MLIATSLLLAAFESSRSQVLPATTAEAQRMEAADALPASALYATPVDLSRSKRGDLLGQETVSGYTLPLSGAVRILYHSTDGLGHEMATSAVILLPHGRRPAAGWPVIAWAHGTSGEAVQCAPSLMKDVYYGDEGLMDMLGAGFAVVATDYHGLGTPGPHLWVNKEAQAWDVIYAVSAAQAAVKELSRQWVADGHSQGGLATWGVAELESTLEDAGYLGAVSVSGTSRLDEFVSYINGNPGGYNYLTYLAASLGALDAGFNPVTFLSDQVMQHYEDSVQRGCWYYGYALYKDLPRGTGVRSGWREIPALQRLQQKSELGAVHLAKPIFVITGEADATVPVNSARDIIARACKTGSVIEFKIYPGLDHDPTMIKSLPAQLRWIRQRFKGVQAKSSCH
jgi:dipeptidyl aminopeptidase/acylaminoacyl peptidase